MEELWIALYEHHYIESTMWRFMQLLLQCLIDVGYKFPELNFKSAIFRPKYQQTSATRRGGKSFSYHPFHTWNPAKEDNDRTDTRSLTIWISDI